MKTRRWRRPLLLGLLLFLFFLALHGLGGRDYIQALVGIQPFSVGESMLGLAYLGAYVAVTLIVPPLLLSAGFLALLGWWQSDG